MPSVRGYRGIAGQPVRPYVLSTFYINSDIWLNLTFLDRNKNPATPTSISYRIDNLTTVDVVLTDTPFTPTGSTASINIPASINVISSDVGQTSQTNQVTVTAIYPDNSQTSQPFIYELVTIQTVGGAGSSI